MSNEVKKTTTRRKYIAAVILGILMLPGIGMMISDEVLWSGADFIMAALLLTAAGVGVDFTLSGKKSRRARLFLLGLIFILFALVWGELAVGLFGSRWAGN